MAKEVSDEVRAVNQAARRAAAQAGKTWTTLSQEERRVFKRQARAATRGKTAAPAAGDAQQANRDKARKAAAAAGQKWRDLTKEQRQTYLKQAKSGS